MQQKQIVGEQDAHASVDDIVQVSYSELSDAVLKKSNVMIYKGSRQQLITKVEEHISQYVELMSANQLIQKKQQQQTEPDKEAYTYENIQGSLSFVKYLEKQNRVFGDLKDEIGKIIGYEIETLLPFK